MRKKYALAAFYFAVSLSAQISVLTYHNDNARTGQNPGETVLLSTALNSTAFGKLFTQNVDGYVYAQPLYVPNVTRWVSA